MFAPRGVDTPTRSDFVATRRAAKTRSRRGDFPRFSWLAGVNGRASHMRRVPSLCPAHASFVLTPSPLWRRFPQRGQEDPCTVHEVQSANPQRPTAPIGEWG